MQIHGKQQPNRWAQIHEIILALFFFPLIFSMSLRFIYHQRSFSSWIWFTSSHQMTSFESKWSCSASFFFSLSLFPVDANHLKFVLRYDRYLFPSTDKNRNCFLLKIWNLWTENLVTVFLDWIFNVWFCSFIYLGAFHVRKVISDTLLYGILPKSTKRTNLRLIRY